jgi:hypothetical protein
MPKNKYSKKDASLETLLDLDGEVFPMDSGYWTKFEASRVDPTKQIPHGIRYSLTLHDRNSNRILGFDNAHGHKPKRKKYGARKVTWDHEHKMEKIHNYEFESASQLIEDFWKAVEEVLK